MSFCHNSNHKKQQKPIHKEPNNPFPPAGLQKKNKPGDLL